MLKNYGRKCDGTIEKLAVTMLILAHGELLHWLRLIIYDTTYLSIFNDGTTSVYSMPKQRRF